MTITLPPPLFDLDESAYVERKRTPRAKFEETLPPPLLEQRLGPLAITLTPFGDPFIPWKDRLCSGCRKPLRNLSCTHSCGGARAGGYFDLCDHCAANDYTADGLPRWGITETSLAIERTRRRVYSDGGGETELRAELERSGLRTQHDAEREEFGRIRSARQLS